MLLDDILPNLPPRGKEQEPLEKQEAVGPLGTPEDIAVLKQVNQDLSRAEAWVMSQNLLTDWEKCERLYLFRVPIQYWEGTLVPRAHLGMPVVLEHIESLLPQIMIGMFGENPPFISKPRPGTPMEAARANDALLAWELEVSDYREQFRLLCKSALKYGTGIGKWGWKECDEKVIELRRALNGRDELEEREITVNINQPTFEWVDNRHILVDPGLRTSDIRQAKFVIHRIYVTLGTLNEWREREGYDIPSEDKLLQLFFPPKEQALSSPLEGSSIDINEDFRAESRDKPTTIDPYKQPLEVVEYWTKEHCYVVLQRRLVIRKSVNEARILPFVSATFVDVLGRFWGLGIAHLIGGEQRVQQGVINAFLDDLALSLNGMFVRQRGANVPTTQVRMRPGGVIDTDTENGIQLMPRQPIPTEALAVIAASDARAQRRTAANEMMVQGSFPAEKSSITRTATGVSTLTAGVGSRLQYFIENMSRQVFIPTLEAYHEMNRKRLKPSQVQQILSRELNIAYQGDVLDLLNAKVKFEILAGAHLQAKRAMAQALPLLFQFVLTEPVMTMLAQLGKKVNIEEMVKMVWQVSGWPNVQDVIQPLNPEEEDRAMFNNPAIQQMIADQSRRQNELNDKLRVIEEENVARSGRDIIRSLLSEATSSVVKQK